MSYTERKLRAELGAKHWHHGQIDHRYKPHNPDYKFKPDDIYRRPAPLGFPQK
jgi:hypothetical protein